jgi:hypothetical protein
MAQQRKLQNRWLVLLGVLLLAVAGGCVALAVAGFWTMMTDLPTPLLMPGTQTVQLAQPGPQIIAYESQSVVGGQAVSSSQPHPSIQATVVGPDGQPVVVRASATSYTYSFGSRAGEALFEFTADQPGQYELTATASGPGAGQPFVLAVGPQRFGPTFLRIFGGICGTAIFALGGIAVLIVALVRHLRSRTASAPPPGA